MQNKEKLIKKLSAIGLSKNEAAVYLALLELGKAGVSQIAQKALLNRTTAYDILHRLISRTLVHASGKSPRQEYIAESPQQIKTIISKELEKKKAELDILEQSIPELTSKHNLSGRPQIKFYEGDSGLKQAYEDTLSSSEEIRAYASIDDMRNTFGNYFENYYKKRASLNIPIRAIFNDTKEAKKVSERNKEELRTTAFVSKEKYGFHPEINIYDNKIMIASWREKLGIIIESEEISDAMKKIFELAWLQAKGK